MISRIPAFADDDHETFHVVVESPRGSRVKLTYESKYDAFMVSRPLSFGHLYPFDWGFVPGTQADDGDPLDAMVIWDVPSFPGVVLPCRPLGVIQLEQTTRKGKRERNDRLIAIPVDAPRDRDLSSHKDLSKRERRELTHFFVSSIFFSDKEPKILGWGGPKDALKLVKRSAKKKKKEK